MKGKQKLIFFIILGLAFIGFIFYGRLKLNRRTSIVEGIVMEKGHSGKTYNYVKYRFYVEGLEYWGSVPIKFCNECKDSCCAIGAKVKVRYEEGNPKNNDLIH